MHWRNPPYGLVHHSARGSQHAAGDYRSVLAARGIAVSMSRKGECWGNAPMKSANGTIAWAASGWDLDCAPCTHATFIQRGATPNRDRSLSSF
jgi:transposase InsO family protein